MRTIKALNKRFGILPGSRIMASEPPPDCIDCPKAGLCRCQCQYIYACLDPSPDTPHWNLGRWPDSWEEFRRLHEIVQKGIKDYFLPVVQLARKIQIDKGRVK